MSNLGGECPDLKSVRQHAFCLSQFCNVDWYSTYSQYLFNCSEALVLYRYVVLHLLCSSVWFEMLGAFKHKIDCSSTVISWKQLRQQFNTALSHREWSRQTWRQTWRHIDGTGHPFHKSPTISRKTTGWSSMTWKSQKKKTEGGDKESYSWAPKGKGKKGKKTFFLFLACGYRSIYIPVHPNVWLIISPIKLSKFAQFGNRLLEAVAGPRSFSLHHSRSLWTHLAVDLRRNTDVLAACRWLVDACGQWFPEGLGHQTDKTTVRFSGT